MTDYPEKIQNLLRSVHKKIIQINFTPFKDIGLTPPQAFTLRAVEKLGDGVTVGEVCRELKTPLSNVTNICDRLELLGLIMRRRDDKDRRKVKLIMTAKGRDYMLKAAAVYGEFNRAMDEGFEDEDKKRITDSFELLDAWLAGYMGKEKDLKI